MIFGLSIVMLAAIATRIACSGLNSKITLSLAGYTNAPWISERYSTREAGAQSVALLRLVNQTAHPYFYYQGTIQLHTERGWIEDTNWAPPDVTVPSVVGPQKEAQIIFPVPAGPYPWRCSVALLETHMQSNPSLGLRAVELLQRVGANVHGGFMVWSAEIAK